MPDKFEMSESIGLFAAAVDSLSLSPSDDDDDLEDEDLEDEDDLDDDDDIEGDVIEDEVPPAGGPDRVSR